MNESKEKIVKTNKESPLQEKLKQTGFVFLSALRYQVARTMFILFTSGYYIINPMLNGHSFNWKLLTIPAFLYIITEPTFKYSITSLVIESLINQKRRKKLVDVFTLFDTLKADLYSLKPSEQVNVYNLLRESSIMFEHINGTLSRLLSLWKTSPEKAKNVLYEDVGMESAKILGEIIYKLDRSSREEALAVVESESSVFSFTYYEEVLQQRAKQKTGLFTFFTLTCVMIMAWLVVFVFTMFNDGILNNNLL